MTDYLYPTPRTSPGLLDGANDILGGEPLEEPVRTRYTSNPDGTITIPAVDGGGNCTWVRGVWDADTTFRYDDYMADTSPPATNRMEGGTAENRYTGGVLSTLLTPVGTLGNTEYIVYFTRRSGQFTRRGESISGWPYLYVDPTYQGTANDGDLYVMWALECAYQAFGDVKYRNLCRRIGRANLEAGRHTGNRINWDIPLDAENGETGIYEYWGENTPFAWARVPRGHGEPGYCLQVNTSVLSGGSPANYAGWGSWFTWQISADEPFISFDFEFDGAGCGRSLELSTNVMGGDPAGDVSVLVPCLSSVAGELTAFSLEAADFWRTANLVWEHRHKTAFYSASYGSDTHSLTNYQGADSIIPKLAFDFTTNPTGYAGAYFGIDTATVISTGTTALKLELQTNVTGNVRVRVDDASAVTHTAIVAVTNGVKATHIIAWGSFDSGAVAHPIEMVRVVPDDHDAGEYLLFGAWFDAITTMADLTPTSFEGFEFGFPAHGAGEPSYACRFANVVLNIDIIDGIPADRDQYRGLTRWTYKWAIDPLYNWIGYGAWRGWTGVGYLWAGGWTHLGIVNPDNSRDMLAMIRDCMATAQDQYASQFPSMPRGPFVPRLGRPSWESVGTQGVVAGSLVDSIYNAWHWAYDDAEASPGLSEDWYGYSYRALLSCASDYYADPTPGMKAILDDWIAWFDLGEQSETDAITWDAKRVGTYGTAELITNGDFASGKTGWTDASSAGGTFSVSGGVATLAYGTGRARMRQGVTVTIGQSYKIRFTTSGFVASEPCLDVGTAAGSGAYVANYTCGNGAQEITITATNTSLWLNFFSQTAGRSYSFDDVSIQNTIGAGVTPGPVVGIIWDTDHWHPPSGYLANGTVRYHYNPAYSYILIAQAMIFKYWTDGDASALKWLRRMTDYLDAQRITAGGTCSIQILKSDLSGYRYVDSSSGKLIIAMRGNEGSGYTTASVTITGDGTGAEVVPRIFGGKIRYYEIKEIGSSYTTISGTVTGDGTGATVALALYDQVVGATDPYHTGWEVFELFNTYALLVLEAMPGGTVNHSITSTTADQDMVDGLEAFFDRNTRDTFPMAILANGLPIHEYGGLDPYHNGSSIDNPMSRDTHARGHLWTESTGPALRAAVLQRLLHA